MNGTIVTLKAFVTTLWVAPLATFPVAVAAELTPWTWLWGLTPAAYIAASVVAAAVVINKYESRQRKRLPAAPAAARVDPI